MAAEKDSFRPANCGWMP